ncbi:phosphoenolpyruvate carboxylase, partial [Deinococcus pimensis]|uniref:phosphoenolpyruvate carboxylase n=1 Tax=Deinococcus pimensis TaxID=309888 RepID=UPI0005EAD12A
MSTLREDVSTLGRALGVVLREQEGEGFFELVESVRALVREARAGQDDARLRDLLVHADTATAEGLVRAFSWYFQLVNLAEEYERVRSLRGRAGPRPQSVEDALLKLRDLGWDAPRVLDLLARVELNLTFTAHPTEMRRRTIRAHLVEIARDLPDLSGEALERVSAHVEAMWGTLELRRLRPTVLDEVKGGLGYVSAISRALPRLERDLRGALRGVFGVDARAGVPVRFSSWMGGDRDGNPFVTPDATRDTLALHAERARELLVATLAQAYADLSQHDGPEEPWREEVRALHDAVRDGEAVDLVGRLDALDTRLRAGGQTRSADHLLLPAVTLARTYGRHLVSLDVREHSALTG